MLTAITMFLQRYDAVMRRRVGGVDVGTTLDEHRGDVEWHGCG
ncbi:MAG TPA: hypothetical protein VH583_24485 [Vicinamibacterales bacterium]